MKLFGIKLSIVLVLFTFGCSNIGVKDKNNGKISFYPAFKSLEVNKDFINLLDKFIEENTADASIFLVVVDRTSENIILTFIANNFSSEYLNQHQPLFYFIRKGINVYIVNGFESFFKLEYGKFSSMNNEKYYKMISYVFENNKITTYDHGIIPFSSPPVQLDSIK
jgi:hypothetical protein